MTDKQLYESLGDEFYHSLRYARDNFYQTLPPFAALKPTNAKLCRAWVVLDHFVDRLIEVQIELDRTRPRL